MSILIRALGVEDMGGGVFRVVLPSRELTQQERATLVSLFPNLTERAYQLLNQEALLEAVCGEEDANAAETARVETPWQSKGKVKKDRDGLPT